MITDMLERMTAFAGEDILELYVNIEGLLDEINYIAHVESIEALGDVVEVQSNELITNVGKVYNDAIIQALAQSGISVIDDEVIPLPILYAILKVVNDASNADNGDILEAFKIDDEDGPIMSLAELSKLMDGPTEHDILTYIESVESGFFSNLCKAFLLDDHDNSQELWAVGRYKAYIKEGTGGITYNYIKRRAYLPLDFNLAYNHLHDEISTITNLNRLVFEYVSLVMATAEPNENLLATALVDLDKYYEGLIYTKLVPLITQEIKGFLQ